MFLKRRTWTISATTSRSACNSTSDRILTSVSLVQLRSLTRELPFNIPFKAKVTLIQKFLADWDTHSLACFDEVHSASADELKKLVKAHFGEYAGLLDHVDAVVEELVERQERNTRERISGCSSSRIRRSPTIAITFQHIAIST